MNLPCVCPASDVHQTDEWKAGYGAGHRDTRQAAAALVAAPQPVARMPLDDSDIDGAWRSIGTEPDGGNLAGGTSLEGWRRAVRWAEAQHGITAIPLADASAPNARELTLTPGGTLPASATPDAELPGMWESADFVGGQDDPASAQPTAEGEHG